MLGGTVRAGNLLKPLRAGGPLPPALHRLTLPEPDQTLLSRGDVAQPSVSPLALCSLTALRPAALWHSGVRGLEDGANTYQVSLSLLDRATLG